MMKQINIEGQASDINMNTAIVYILGAGRSGTTLLEIALSNNYNFFAVGELVRLFKLKGKPHGISEEENSYKFWEKVMNEFFSKNPDRNYEELYGFFNKIEHHTNFLHNYFLLKKQDAYSEYSKLINDLFESIYNNISERIIIDSSKYPGRALAFHRFLNYPIYYIYLKRHPIGVINSFLKKGVEQPGQGFFHANIYYFFMNFFSRLVKLKVPKSRFITVKYENFINNPETEMERIQNKFDLALKESMERLKSNKSLKVGYLFDGNRVRLNSEIYLKRQKVKFKTNLKNFFTFLINGIWYHF